MSPGEEYVAFYTEIGLTVTQWAAVEIGLCSVAGMCFDAKQRTELVAGFYAIENFRSKVEFVDRVVRASVRDGVRLADWDALLDRATNASKKRNKVVHYHVVDWMTNSPGRRYALQPWRKIDAQTTKKRANSPSATRPPPGALCLREVVQIRYQFFALVASLQNFVCRWAGLPEQFPKSAEQAMDPPTIRTLGNQTRAALGLPVRPSQKKS